MDLAIHILQMVQRHWQDHYEMWKLLEAFKYIEKDFTTNKNTQELQKFKGGEVSSIKKMFSFSELILEDTAWMQVLCLVQ